MTIVHLTVNILPPESQWMFNTVQFTGAKDHFTPNRPHSTTGELATISHTTDQSAITEVHLNDRIKNY